MKLSARVAALYDYAEANPEGFNRYDIQNELGWPLAEFNIAVHHLRKALADTEATLICDPDGKGNPWVYRLVGSLEETQKWRVNRTQDTQTRLKTLWATNHAMVNATAADPTSLDGKRARIIDKYLTRLGVDLAELGAEN